MQFQEGEDDEGLEEAVNAAYPKKSAYLGAVGQRLQKTNVRRVESHRSDGSGVTLMSSATHESAGSGGSTTAGAHALPHPYPHPSPSCPK